MDSIEKMKTMIRIYEQTAEELKPYIVGLKKQKCTNYDEHEQLSARIAVLEEEMFELICDIRDMKKYLRAWKAEMT